MSVWDLMVGQDHVVAQLDEAVRSARAGAESQGMTHAWLVTGPPGSGRSLAAIAFATALVCPNGGCGNCSSCQDVQRGNHPDVTIVRPEGVILGVEATRELVSRAAVTPTRGNWNVIVIEDADRLNEHADNALLKTLEEPPEHAVWILCAPSSDDLLATIRSRCRVVRLRQPQPAEVAAFLCEQLAVEPAMASFAAHAAQGHIGRAKAIATHEAVREQYLQTLRIPERLRSVAECMSVATEVAAAATEQVELTVGPIETAETQALLTSYGEGGTGTRSARARASAALKELERSQRNRRRRMLRDELDRVLLDLLGLYRDVLVRICAGQEPENDAYQNQVLHQLVARFDAASVLRRVDALSHARAALAADGDEQLVLSSAFINLVEPSRSPLRYQVSS